MNFEKPSAFSNPTDKDELDLQESLDIHTTTSIADDIENTQDLPGTEKQLEQESMSPKEKKYLARIWQDIVVDSGTTPKKPEDMSSDEIKRYLDESLSSDAEKLAEEWSLKDVEAEKEILEEQNPERQSSLILHYLKDIRSAMDHVKKEGMKAGISRKCSSWPKQMRVNRNFNCAGASILAMEIIKKLKVEAYYGLPCGHVANVFKLPNGQWTYADFSNISQIHVVGAEEIEIRKTRALKISHPRIHYRIIPLISSSEAPEFLLGNLSIMEKDALNPDMLDDNPDKIRAKQLLERYDDDFKHLDLSNLKSYLYPDTCDIFDAPEMVSEQERLEVISNFIALFNSFFIKAPRLRQEFIENTGCAEAFILGQETQMPKNLSSDMEKMLIEVRDGLERTRSDNPEAYSSIRQILNSITQDAKQDVQK